MKLFNLLNTLKSVNLPDFKVGKTINDFNFKIGMGSNYAPFAAFGWIVINKSNFNIREIINKLNAKIRKVTNKLHPSVKRDALAFAVGCNGLVANERHTNQRDNNC